MKMSKCQNCHKGIAIGHAVSHAKNRIRRIFKPNLQKLKVLRNGVAVKVILCTSCIKRLRKDGKIGAYFIWKPQLVKETVKAAKRTKIEAPAEKKVKEEKASQSLNIESIVGKKE
ncbi:50S ribosomal protein L28 [Patescibacteria group bacterium]|nr:50S ribosomal protein L28 [Patescibacteria group bacterium]MCL5797580.1 50S ribosomal protein L28 [Patescibacteria group bacterium]